MTKEKTVFDASKQLPEKVRKLFIQTFEECNVMDLYGGEVEVYFQVILQKIRDQNRQREKMQEAVNEARKHLSAISSSLARA
jgi:hypothetical protein